MYALGRFTPLSMKEIGKAVGRSAGAVSKACKAIGVQVAEDAEVARRMRLVARKLQSKTSPNSPSASPHNPSIPAH